MCNEIKMMSVHFRKLITFLAIVNYCPISMIYVMMIIMKYVVFAALLYNTIELEARVSDVDGSKRLSASYAWSVLNIYLNVVDALLEDYSHLNVRVCL